MMTTRVQSIVHFVLDLSNVVLGLKGLQQHRLDFYWELLILNEKKLSYLLIVITTKKD